jgi:acyl transferase domain-containing protein/NAD(P)-dependent dehydrogenase (short-subunit alcohol dehydrogenase family)/aryl carrier-like protein
MHNESSCSRDSTSPNEPLAIIGIGCRFPGRANDPELFWKLLVDRVDAVTDVPADRWNHLAFYDPDPAKPGKTLARWGGFLEGIDRFDPGFFGISPREAVRMDPQQRLLLEVAYEALEDGGQTLERLSGGNTSVFVGISSWDYSNLGTSCRDRGLIDGYSNTGGSLSIAANRISYCFDFKGPSVSVDTACSSALVAVNLACQSIWVDRRPLALAGGVNALLLPDSYIGFSRLGMLSPDGRCKAFDAEANGFVRGEGAGMVLLKPLAQARADGDRIYAVIRGAAVNQDGRTPGMTVPSQDAQEALLRDACRNAGVSPADIQYVEAHGTGTPVGDPIEARALGRVLSEGRTGGTPCLIGSVKTNIGHLEAGSGIAGLIKTALALYHRCIPGNLHFTQPNPEIDFADLQLRIPVATVPWPNEDKSFLAGVNSFGYGGTNAHVILQGPPCEDDKMTRRQGDNATKEAAHPPGTLPPWHLLPLSARSNQALLAAAGALRQFLTTCPEGVSLQDIAHSASLRRSHHDHRLTIVAHSRQELSDGLAAFVAGQPTPSVCSGRAIPNRRPRLAFVCSGQGPQWWAMGRQLLAQESVFREMIQRCDAILRELGPWSLLAEFIGEETSSRMSQTRISQPALFALQAGLAALWDSWGVRPEAVVGHSVGEVAAAYIAGVFSLEDAVRIIYQRGRCMELASSGGRMLAAGLSVQQARRIVAGQEGRICLAAVNSPAFVTFSGEVGPLEEIAGLLEQEQVFCRFLQVNYAFHSSQMDPVREPLIASLDGIRPRPADRPFFSTVTGRKVNGPELGPEYWWDNVRQTVRFADGVDQLIGMDIDTVLELSPHPVLTTAVGECYQLQGKKVSVFSSLRRHEKERSSLLRSLGQLHTLGCPIDWEGVRPGGKQLGMSAPPFVRLPLYPWQRETLWFEAEESRTTRLTAPTHPLLGCPLGRAHPSWESRLDLRLFPYLRDHRIQGTPIVPASAWVSMAFAAAREVFQSTSCQIEDAKLLNPCFLPPDRAMRVETVFSPDNATFQIHGRAMEGNQGWTAHFRAVVRSIQPALAQASSCLDGVKQRCSRPFSQAECYAHLQKIGLDYGPLFQGVEQGWQGDRESLGVICFPEGQPSEDSLFHPAVLDACFQVVIFADRDFDVGMDGLCLPVEIEQLRLYRAPGRRLWSHARLIEKTKSWSVADIDIYDNNGELTAEVRGLRSQRVDGGEREETPDDLLYTYEWQPCVIPPVDQVKGGWLIFADHGGVGERLAERLRTVGASPTLVFAATAYGRTEDDHFSLRAGSKEDMVRLLNEVMASGRRGWRGLVHLWNLDAPPSEDLKTSDLESAQEAGLLSVLHLVQAWDSLELPSDPAPELVLVTRGAQSVGKNPEPIAIAQAPLIGLGRVIVSEYPGFRCKLVDLDPAVDDDRALFDELGVRDAEDEIALRGSVRHAHRFVHSTPIVGTGPFQVANERPGTLDGLTPRPLRRRQPGPGEVEIQVVAAGLNFSDVLKALGIYPGLPDGPVPLGAECSGRITAVGEGVREFHPGDEVLAVAPFAFGSHVTTRADLVAAKPSRLTFEEAAAIPIAFLTASYALDHLGGLGAGERVLIHSATGGVGLAAVQLAQRAGAVIFATAGAEEKRIYLKDLGIAHVMDSRSLAFADQILEHTGGRGVDVVLNSLPGEALARSLATLADYGRFLEIGKRDIYQNARLGLRPFRKNLSFFAIDLDRMIRERPALLGDILRKLAQEMEDGSPAPLPHRIFPMSELVDACRYMQQSKHIGKIVLRNPDRQHEMNGADETPKKHDPGVNGVPSASRRCDSVARIFPENCPEGATYLITGGLGGFGLAAAKWMAKLGARHLVLVGRRGIHSEEAQQAVSELETEGVRVVVKQADVSKEEEVAGVLADIDRTLPPLRGVLHAAMVLEDGLLVNLDNDLMRRVIAPKMNGAWNLHTQTLSRPLDFFILFSSLSSVFGHAGQGNYAAANAFLDGLAWHRRAKGLPCLTINWGYLGEVGYLAERRELGERLERQGVKSFSVEQALTLLEDAMLRQSIQISVMRMDWSRWRGMGVTGRVSPRFAHLFPQLQAVAGKGKGVDAPALETVLAAAPGERRGLLDTLLRDKVARVLGTSPDKLDVEKRLLHLGLDSLMAVELRNWIEGELRVRFPIVELMRSPSLSGLTEILLGQLTPPTSDSVLSTEYSALTEEQTDALLTTLLIEQQHLIPGSNGAVEKGSNTP